MRTLRVMSRVKSHSTFSAEVTTRVLCQRSSATAAQRPRLLRQITLGYSVLCPTDHSFGNFLLTPIEKRAAPLSLASSSHPIYQVLLGRYAA